MIRRHLALVTLIGSAALLSPIGAAANMANPSQPGQAAGEPGGQLDQMHVEHEQLNIDLRPLEHGAPAHVEATYSIRNDGPERNVELVFVAAGLDGTDSGVWLNGQSVSFRAAEGPLPVSWRPPATTPGLDSAALPYLDGSPGQLLFTLALAPGRHDVRVSYSARAGAYSGASPTRFWQLGYVLSPARSWASFGTLDVAVQLPPGWAVATDPPLARTGDELRGSFDGVPADSLAISTQSPAPPFPMLWALLAVAIVAVVGALIARAGGRALGRRRRSSLWLLPVSAVASVIGAFVVVWVSVGTLGGQLVPVTQRAWTYGYGATLLLFLAFPLIALGLVVLMQVTAAWSRRRIRPQTR